MQLNELEQRWQQLDQKLDRTLALGSEFMKQLMVKPAQRRINWHAFWPALDIAFCCMVLWPTGSILYQHGHQASVLFPTLITMASTLALLISCIYQLQLTADIIWDGPVVAIQTKLEILRVAKITQFKWIILLSPLAGFCGIVTLLHGLFAWQSDNRFNFIDRIHQPWLMVNYIFGVLFLLFGHLLAGYLARKFQHHRWWQALLDDISGKSLNTAAADLRKWEAFTG